VFGANNVLNYEVVLSNGTIVNANKDEHEDLFWAMKLASTNYGIVTRFDMSTYPSSAIWGAVSVYPATPAVASELYAQSEKLGHNDKNKANMLAVVMARNKGASMAMAVQVNGDAVPQDPPTSMPPVTRSELVGSTHKVINKVIDSVIASTTRTRWSTITTKIDVDYFRDMFVKGEQIMKDFDNRENLLWTITIQHFQKSFISGARETPFYNALGQGKDDLVSKYWLCFVVSCT
jgi:hypothetical protein